MHAADRQRAHRAERLLNLRKEPCDLPTVKEKLTSLFPELRAPEAFRTMHMTVTRTRHESSVTVYTHSRPYITVRAT